MLGNCAIMRFAQIFRLVYGHGMVGVKGCDAVEQGAETIGNLAGSLLNSIVWFFWWDWPSIVIKAL